MKIKRLIEVVDLKDGTVRIDRHGEDCERTREVANAFENGGPVFHPDHPRSARCGPAMVNSEAYRNGWDGIFGKKLPTGQA